MTNLVNASHPIIEANNHRGFMEYALELAQQSPPASTKFCVGAVLVDTQSGRILSVGYSMELAGQMNGDKGNTHAEQCCFIKVALDTDYPQFMLKIILEKSCDPVPYFTRPWSHVTKDLAAIRLVLREF